MAVVIPWEAIRQEYVEGRRNYSRVDGGVVYPTYDELARRYTIGLSSVATRGAREGWAKLRQQFQAQIVQRANTTVTHRETLISLDQAAIDAAERGIGCISALFDRFGDQLRDKTRTKQQILSDFVDLEQIARALRTFQDVGQSRAAAAKGGY